MARNTKQTSTPVTTLASKTLRSTQSSALQKSLAATTLAQSGTSKQTGAKMEGIASKALRSEKTNAVTKTLAASVVSQSNKKR